MAVKNELVDQVMEAIVGASKTGKVGDGKIFVTDISEYCASGPARPITPPSKAPGKIP